MILDPHNISARVEAAVGGGLFAAPLWVTVLRDAVGPIASAVAAVCGAIIGLHAVYRLIRPKRK